MPLTDWAYSLYSWVLMSRDLTPFSDDCLVPQTVKHLLVECPSFGEARSRFLSCKDREGRYVLREIIGKSFNETDLFGFVNEIGLLNQI